MNSLKEVIESKFGSVNKFSNNIDKTILSKQTVYKLLSTAKPNPTLSTLLALSHYLQTDIVEIINLFKTKEPEVLENNVTI